MINWTIRRRILLSFALMIVAMGVMGAVAYVELSKIDRQASDLSSRSLPQLAYSSQLLAAWNENYSIAQELVIVEDDSEFDTLNAEIQASLARIDESLNKYAAVANPEERQHADAVKALIAPYRTVQEQILRIGASMKALPPGPASSSQRSALSSEALALLRQQLDPQFDRVRDAVEEMVSLTDTDAGTSAALIGEAVAAARTAIAISIAAAVALAFVCGFFLLGAVTRPLGWLVGVMDRMREGDFTQRVDRTDEFGALGESFNHMADELSSLFGQVQKSGSQVSSSVTQIAATAKQQQATASEIAATTTEIGATSKEISATSKELVKTMNEVSTVAEETAALAGSGHTGLSHMEDTMHHVMEAAGSINAKLAVLNEKAGNINQVVTTITKVADQTNLLSLNAAIEAEKAGEYGRGFAVVASEIRRLADQTAVATYDIEQMVKEIKSAVSAGVMGMDIFSEEVRRGMEDVQQVATQLTQIIQQVQALVPRFEMANEGMQAQATGAEQITEALLQLTEAAQQTVESLRQSTFAIDDLNQVSATLRSSVSRVKLLDAAA
jgi:methyl-accepting chemotaxis protein WspA